MMLMELDLGFAFRLLDVDVHIGCMLRKYWIQLPLTRLLGRLHSL
jgi:hypothetical protein